MGFLSAYMSTISTQLNWGSSYLTNDLYRRFFKPEASNQHYVAAGRVITLLIMLVAMFSTSQIGMIDEAAQFLIASGAGLGMVLILRWYWWRINAWSELSATIAPLFAWALLKYPLRNYLPDAFYQQNGDFIGTVVFTTLVWLLVTFLTKPTDSTLLREFYLKIRPQGFWKPFRSEAEPKSSTGALFGAWLSGVLLVYSTLFALGAWIFNEYQEAFIWSGLLVVALFSLGFFMRRSDLYTKS